MIETKITVITPTFNRSHTLKNVFESLVDQSNLNFKWLIIDDGSTDNTKEKISSFSKSLFSIQYVYKENGGKASALNTAFALIDTEYFVVLDSDDIFSKNAIHYALIELDKYKSDDDIIGIVNLRHNKSNTVLGGKEIPKSIGKIRRVDLEDKLGINSEIIVFYKSSILSSGLRFPSFVGEKFISPSFLEFEATKNKYFKVVHQVFCYCEYLEDGLTKNKKSVIKKNPRGYTLVKKQSFTYSSNFRQILKHGLMYIVGSILSKNKRYITESPRKILSVILTPIGYIVYLIKFRK
jgi:glycosyltransferase involved in cell wall biosynthesis